MAPNVHGLGPLEMEVLGLLHGDTEKSVSDIVSNLEKDLAYTTVMTVLSRLYDKGLVTRQKRGRQYMYLQAKKAGKFEETFLSRVRTSLFKNRRLEPILNLLDHDDELSIDELNELKEIVNQKIKKRLK